MFERLNAIDIGSCYIKIASGRKKMNGSIDLRSVDIVGTPPGLIEDGVITNPQLLADSLRKPINRLVRFSQETILTVESSRIITRDILVPKVPTKDLERMMQMEAENHLPVGRGDHIVDYKVIDEIPPPMPGEAAQYKVMLVALPIDISNRYAEFLSCSGLNCYSIDFSGNSLAKQVTTEMKEKDLTTVILDIGHKSTSATMMSNGRFQFFRSFPFGGEMMTRSIADRLALGMEAAESLKKEYGLAGDETALDGHGLHVSAAIQDVLNPFLHNLASYFEFYVSREAGNAIDKIVLTGGGSLMKNIESYVMKTFNIETTKHKRKVPLGGKKSGSAKVSKSQRKEVGAYFANCLGAIK